MDITNFANQIVFPLVLFVIVFSLFHLETHSVNHSVNLNDNLFNQINYLSELDKFYETINKNNNLMYQLESILEQENYIEELVNLGKALGYEFTPLDIEQSIKENTANINGNYICLPIGCWQVS